MNSSKLEELSRVERPLFDSSIEREVVNNFDDIKQDQCLDQANELLVSQDPMINEALKTDHQLTALLHDKPPTATASLWKEEMESSLYSQDSSSGITMMNPLSLTEDKMSAHLKPETVGVIGFQDFGKNSHDRSGPCHQYYALDEQCHEVSRLQGQMERFGDKNFYGHSNGLPIFPDRSFHADMEIDSVEDDNIQFSVCGKASSCLSDGQKLKKICSGTNLYKCSTCMDEFSLPSDTHTQSDYQAVGRPNENAKSGADFSHESTARKVVQTPYGKASFICGMCGKTFYKGSNLRIHLRTHTRERPYECTICGKAFIDNSNLHSHRKIHAGIKSYLCSKCGKAFSRNYTLKTHMKTHMRENPFECSKCGRKFSQSASINSHMRIHAKTKVYQCPKCDETFTSKQARHNHMKGHMEESMQDCPALDEMFSDNAYRDTQMDFCSVTNCYICLLCGEEFHDYADYRKHQKNHLAEKLFKCLVCGLAFPKKYNLQMHMRTHTKERPYECSECCKSFSRKFTLNRHKLIHLKEKYFKCNQCNTVFPTRQMRIDHMKNQNHEVTYEHISNGGSFSDDSFLNTPNTFQVGDKS